MKRNWKIAAIIGLVAVLSLATVGAAYADSNSTTTNCQCQSLCIFSSVTPENNSPLVHTAANITNNGETINVTVTNDYPGYDVGISFILFNENPTPGTVSSISYINPNTYFTVTPLNGIIQGQTIDANQKITGTFDINFISGAPNSTMGKTYTMSLTIVVTQLVPPSPAKTSTCLSSMPNPSIFGQQVTFTANVIPSTAAGTVTFYDGSTILKSNISLTSGSASINVGTLTVGSHNISAVYNGNSNFVSSTSNVVVQKVHSKTTITWPYKLNPCSWGQPCIFTCQLGWQGSGTPTGMVTFYDGSNSIGTCNLSSNGSASFCIGNLGVGSHNITAVYNGDDNNDGCTSNAVTQIVNNVNTKTILTSSANSVKAGSPITFTATVTPNSATGTVTFKDCNSVLGTGTLNNGQAILSTSKLSSGTHSITAVYGGDANCNSSTSNTINPVISIK